MIGIRQLDSNFPSSLISLNTSNASLNQKNKSTSSVSKYTWILENHLLTRRALLTVSWWCVKLS